MENIKKGLSLTTVSLAILGLLKVFPMNIVNPIILISCGTLLVVTAIEYKRKKDFKSFVINLIGGIVMYFVMLYLVFGR